MKIGEKNQSKIQETGRTKKRTLFMFLCRLLRYFFFYCLRQITTLCFYWFRNKCEQEQEIEDS
jgi:hypothetical protein